MVCLGHPHHHPQDTATPAYSFPTVDMIFFFFFLTYIRLAGSSVPFVRNVFTLNSCSHIAGSQVLEFQSEEKLLAKWQAFVAECDPDLVIGYNTSNFDMPYLLDRAKALKVTSFPYLGRMKSQPPSPSSSFFLTVGSK
jgi:DNA polymerase delta subunit 1